MNHPHIIFKTNYTSREVPNFSLIIAFYARAYLLEQCVESIISNAVNKNHEIIAIADHDEHLIDAFYPTKKLAERIDKTAYFRKKENYDKMRSLVQEEKMTIRKCMSEYSDINWVSLFEYLRKEKSVGGFDYNLNFPTDGRPGRGNFYLSYNLGARLAKNDYIMQMINDDMIFGPEWDLKMWRVFHDKDKGCHTCVPFTFTGGKTTQKELFSNGAEPFYEIKENNFAMQNAFVFEEEFEVHASSLRLHSSYLIEMQHDRHYGYMGMMLMHKNLFFAVNGYNFDAYPQNSQDIYLDTRLSKKNVKKIVALDAIHLHEPIIYVTERNKEFTYGN